MARARSASTFSESSASSSARAIPIARGNRYVEPASGIRPIRMNAMLNEASSLARRISQARASETPAPATTPLTAATTGLGQPVRSGMSLL